MNRINEKFAELKQKQEKGLIGFIMAGQPDFQTGVDCARTLEDAGCDILEIGVPYSDPIADGDVIEKAHFKGVEQGMNMSQALEFMSAIRDKCALPLVMFSYFNPIFRRGMPKFVQELKSAGGSAAIIPDIPLEERVRYESDDLDIIPMLAPSSNADRISQTDKAARSFIYCVSVAGVTGIRNQLPDLQDYLQRVRANTTHPLAVGFGISSPEQIIALKDYVDALVVGSVLVKTIEQYAEEKTLLFRELNNTMSSLKKAAR
ncbi:MAG: tryptophan synthase subunit alpha [Firmicutes bacterium HGW-Firmicutes-15]|nr:MAG: tryptophan synthase subunit alpha [Firmicutes bacterium HGW-Firmicutes-15]